MGPRGSATRVGPCGQMLMTRATGLVVGARRSQRQWKPGALKRKNRMEGYSENQELRLNRPGGGGLGSSYQQDLAHRLKLPISAHIFAVAGEDKTILIWHGL